MPRLIVRKIGGTEQSSRPLAELTFHHSPLRIGRAPDNDVRLVAGAVSRYHAEIVREGECRWKVINRSQTGDLVVGGSSLSAYALNDGENIVIRPFALTFFEDATALRPTPKPGGSGGGDGGNTIVAATPPDEPSKTDSHTITPPPWPPASPPDGRFPKIKGYEIIRLIAEGGMGAIYEAIEILSNQRRAIKVIRGDLLRTREAREWFVKLDVRLGAKLNHPNIVKIHHAGTDESGQPFYAMDYLEGMTLDEYPKKHRPSVRQVLELFRKITDAVGYAHTVHKIIHRDIKPNNVFVTTADGEPHLLDFGLAVQEMDDGTYDFSASLRGPFGAQAWRSPEHWEADVSKITAASDVYCLGLCLFHLLTDGGFPYRVGLPPAEARKVIQSEPLVFPTTLPKGFDHEVKTIIRKCLEKDPARRYQNAAELSAMIGRKLDGRSLPPPVEGTIYPFYWASKMLHRHWRQACMAVAVAAIVVGAGISIYLLSGRLRQAVGWGRNTAEGYLEDLRASIEKETWADAYYSSRGLTRLAEAMPGGGAGAWQGLTDVFHKFRGLSQGPSIADMHVALAQISLIERQGLKTVDPNHLVSVRHVSARLILSKRIAEVKRDMEQEEFAEAFRQLAEAHQLWALLEEKDRADWSKAVAVACKNLATLASDESMDPNRDLIIAAWVKQGCDSLNKTDARAEMARFKTQVVERLEAKLGKRLDAASWPAGAAACAALAVLTGAPEQSLHEELRGFLDGLNAVAPQVVSAWTERFRGVEIAVKRSPPEPFGNRLRLVRTAIVDKIVTLATSLRSKEDWKDMLALLRPVMEAQGADDRVRTLAEAAETGTQRDRDGEAALKEAEGLVGPEIIGDKEVQRLIQLARLHATSKSRPGLIDALRKGRDRLGQRLQSEIAKPPLERDLFLTERTCEVIKVTNQTLGEVQATPTSVPQELDGTIEKAERVLDKEKRAADELKALRAVDTERLEPNDIEKVDKAATDYADTRSGQELASIRDRLRNRAFQQGRQALEQWHWKRAESLLQAVANCRTRDPLTVQSQTLLVKATTGGMRSDDASIRAVQASGHIIDAAYDRASALLKEALASLGDTPRTSQLEQLLKVADALPSVEKRVKDKEYVLASKELSELGTALVHGDLAVAKRECHELAARSTELERAASVLGDARSKIKDKAFAGWEDLVGKLAGQCDPVRPDIRLSVGSLLTPIGQKLRAASEVVVNELTATQAGLRAKLELQRLNHLIESKGDCSAVEKTKKDFDRLTAQFEPIALPEEIEEIRSMRSKAGEAMTKAKNAERNLDELLGSLVVGDYDNAEKLSGQAVAACEGTWLSSKAQGLDKLACNHGFAGRIPRDRGGVPDGPQWIYINSIGMKFVRIPPVLESPPQQLHAGVNEVTNTQYLQFDAQHKSGMRLEQLDGDDQPVVRVSWKDSMDFCEWLTRREKLAAADTRAPTPWRYTLPTSEQWEHACRAGGNRGWLYHFGNDWTKLKEYAWYDDSSGLALLFRRSHPVGQLKANAWGLYDTHGNVWEWTATQNPLDGREYYICGGSWGATGGDCRASPWNAEVGDGARISRDLYKGFRVIRVIEPKQPTTTGQVRPAVPTSR